MQKTAHIKQLLLLLFAVSVTGIFNLARAEEKDRTCSPYFHVNSTNPDVDKLPLKHTEAEVNIAGVIADVKVKQIYENTGEGPIEAIYVFPGSTRAAVYGMKMTIGERVLEAKIQKKEEARQTYETAKAEGKTTSLLEQHRPNVFQMNVANIMPGDKVVVELSYTELLVPEEGEYEFVYPTVVGPRYQNEAQEQITASEKWVGNPYQNEGEAPLYTYNMTAHINAGMPIQKAVCTSHDVNVNFLGKNAADIKLKDHEKTGGNRDFIVKYQLAGAKIQSGVLVYEGKDENFFLAMVQPPKRVTPENIPGREYIFIVDVSGSMNGFPLDISKDLLKNLIGSLKPTDMFNVMLFAGSSSVMAPQSMPATQKNINDAVNHISKQRGGGGTELLPALKRALALPQSEGYSRSVVIATDGYVTVEKEAFDLIRNNLGMSNFFAFGIGSSVNRYIIEGMARVGMGEPFVVTDSRYAKEEADKMKKYIESPVLTKINLGYDGFAAYDTDPTSVPDVLAERPIIITGKFKGSASGKIKVEGYTGNGEKFTTTLDLSTASKAKENSALKYLWARNRIQLLDDYKVVGNGQGMIDEVTNLGLKYNLLTAYTSFVAVDTEARNIGGTQTTVEQPLPLPEGVSNMAKGGYNQSTSYNSGLGSAQQLNSVVVSAGKYEQKVQDLAVSMEVIEPAKSKSVGRAKAYTNGTVVMAEDSENSYDWDAHADRKAAEKEAKREEAAAKMAAEKEAMAEAQRKREEEEKVYEVGLIEKEPEYTGGKDKMMEFIKANLKYPEFEKNNAIEGTVYVSFVVDQQGKISDIKIARSISKGLDDEVIRIIKLMPNWVPGTKDGKAVKVRYTLPIAFKLNN